MIETQRAISENPGWYRCARSLNLERLANGFHGTSTLFPPPFFFFAFFPASTSGTIIKRGSRVATAIRYFAGKPIRARHRAASKRISRPRLITIIRGPRETKTSFGFGYPLDASIFARTIADRIVSGLREESKRNAPEWLL